MTNPVKLQNFLPLNFVLYGSYITMHNYSARKILLLAIHFIHRLYLCFKKPTINICHQSTYMKLSINKSYPLKEWDMVLPILSPVYHNSTQIKKIKNS